MSRLHFRSYMHTHQYVMCQMQESIKPTKKYTLRAIQMLEQMSIPNRHCREQNHIIHQTKCTSGADVPCKSPALQPQEKPSHGLKRQVDRHLNKGKKSKWIIWSPSLHILFSSFTFVHNCVCNYANHIKELPPEIQMLVHPLKSCTEPTVKNVYVK